MNFIKISGFCLGVALFASSPVLFADQDEMGMPLKTVEDTTLLKAPRGSKKRAKSPTAVFPVRNGAVEFTHKVAMSCLSTADSKITATDSDHVQISDKNPACALEIRKLSREWSMATAPVKTLRTIHASTRARAGEIIRRVHAKLANQISAKSAAFCPCVVFRGDGADQAFDIAFPMKAE